MFEHLLGMEIRDEKGDIVSLNPVSTASQTIQYLTNLDRFSSEDKKSLCPLRQEPRKFVYQNMLNLVCLLDLDADPDAVNARLNQDPLILVPRNSYWV
jgi:hypothetical protein